jgi:sporulation protein YlmC with PRC-barrel domain
MLREIKDLEGDAIAATDGLIGTVKDSYFDDEAWAIRYLVVDTGTWLSSRMVLVSPIAIGKANWNEATISVALTREQVKNSPDIDTKKPVTRQHEQDHLGYYGYPYYWGGVGLWGGGMYPYAMLPGYAGYGSVSAARDQEKVAYARSQAQHRDDDLHLRSCNAAIGYHIRASDGEIGHVQGMLVDPETWAVRYLIVDTSNWWLGHKMLVAPQWIESVSWADRTVSVGLTRQAVKDAPAYDSATTLPREDEARLYDHYGRSGYWATSEKRDTEISRI